VEFEWDADKATSNLTKHGVTFAEAMTVFAEQLELMIPDPVHATNGFESSVRGRQLARSAVNMNQGLDPNEDDEMLPEYDFTHGVRGKHHEAYKGGTNVVFLEPDLAKVFTNSAQVNRVLRLLLHLAQESVPPNKPA
jgi:hypothetical protein